MEKKTKEKAVFRSSVFVALNNVIDARSRSTTRTSQNEANQHPQATSKRTNARTPARQNGRHVAEEAANFGQLRASSRRHHLRRFSRHLHQSKSRQPKKHGGGLAEAWRAGVDAANNAGGQHASMSTKLPRLPLRNGRATSYSLVSRVSRTFPAVSS